MISYNTSSSSSSLSGENDSDSSVEDEIMAFFEQDPSSSELGKVSSKPVKASTISGIEDQVKDFLMSYKLMPDVVFSLTDVKVCKSSNSAGSRIVAKTSVRGTLLYSVRKRTMITENGDLIECDSGIISTTTTTTGEGVEGIDDVILDRLESPLDYEMNGILTLHLDEQHRMVLIEIQPLES
eukprot:gene435-468_t